MYLFIARRLASNVVVFIVVCSAAYSLLFLSGASVALNLLGTDATPEQIVAKEQELGLDQPLLMRLGAWWAKALGGDLGVSWYNGQPVWESIMNRLPMTLALVIASTLATVVVAVLLAGSAAVHRGWPDKTIQVLSTIGSAVPNFLIAIFLVAVFAVQLGWFPAISTISAGAGVGDWVTSLALPVIALTIGSATAVTQQLRNGLLSQMDADYVRTLRSRGTSGLEILTVHVLRNAAPPTLTVLGLQFIGMLGGVVVIEHLFALSGIGSLALTATSTSDTPLVMGIVVYTILVVVIVNLLVDLLNAWLNPKVRTA
ncbi:ABC transporter permease [Paenarthrobacter sp. YIM B13468]|uniref:ABC transporter permease n=1 Tax=Paenarthrobacter sp. YIM B13468 TaxID=3366295 RepID=UPI00366F381D